LKNKFNKKSLTPPLFRNQQSLITQNETSFLGKNKKQLCIQLDPDFLSSYFFMDEILYLFLGQINQKHYLNEKN
jgi:hypothetical protein